VIWRRRRKRSEDELVQALRDLRGELERQNEFADAVCATSNYQLTKNLADLLSGHIVGKGVAGRRFEPGDGPEASYS
jgi:hypothetical protein